MPPVIIAISLIFRHASCFYLPRLLPILPLDASFPRVYTTGWSEYRGSKIEEGNWKIKEIEEKD